MTRPLAQPILPRLSWSYLSRRSGGRRECCFTSTAIALSRNRSRQKQERQVHQLNIEKIAAEKANKAKDDFLAVLSHELRTPLTPALAAASYLAEHEDLSPELREEVIAIRTSVQLEARLIDDLLDLTRITRGKIELHLEVVDVHGLLRNSLEIARDNILQKHLDLVSGLWRGSPPCLGRCCSTSAGVLESDKQCSEV